MDCKFCPVKRRCKVESEDGVGCLDVLEEWLKEQAGNEDKEN